MLSCDSRLQERLNALTGHAVSASWAGRASSASDVSDAIGAIESSCARCADDERQAAGNARCAQLCQPCGYSEQREPCQLCQRCLEKNKLSALECKAHGEMSLLCEEKTRTQSCGETCIYFSAVVPLFLFDVFERYMNSEAVSS